MKRPSLKTLPRGWRLSRDGKLVRDVVLLPGAKVHWLPASFDKIEEQTVERIGADDAELVDSDGPWPADEMYQSHEAAQSALALRTAADVRAGTSACPCCRCRSMVRKSGRRSAWCGFCLQRWTVAPPTGGRR